MSDHPILTAGQVREEVLDGVRYTLRALTYADVSALQVAALHRPRPSEAVLGDAVARACEARSRPDLAQAVARHDAAQDAIGALYFTRPSSADAAGEAQWLKERGADLEAAQRALLAAERQRTVALHLAHDDPEVAALRMQMVQFIQGDALGLVGMGVTAIDGATWPATEAAAEALPAAHVAHLARLLRDMNTPGESAVKN